MERYDGNLSDEISNGRLTSTRSIEILKEITNVIAALHKSGIAHMNLRTDCILISGNRTVLSDFSTSVMFNDTTLPRPVFDVSILHTGFAAPEVLAATTWDGIVPSAADVYALGMVMFYVATNRLPLVGRSQEAAIKDIEDGEVLSSAIKDVSDSVPCKPLMVQCLAIDQHARPSMHDFSQSFSSIHARDLAK